MIGDSSIWRALANRLVNSLLTINYPWIFLLRIRSSHPRKSLSELFLPVNYAAAAAVLDCCWRSISTTIYGVINSRRTFW